jgi:hypothetical protein
MLLFIAKSFLSIRLYPVSVNAKLPKGSPLAESNPQLISIYSGSY